MSTGSINPKVIEFVVTYRPCPLAEDIFVVSGSFEVSGNAEVSDACVNMFEKGMIVGAAAFGKQVQVYFSHKPEHWPDDAHLRSRIVEQFDDINNKQLTQMKTWNDDKCPKSRDGAHAFEPSCELDYIDLNEYCRYCGKSSRRHVPQERQNNPPTKLEAFAHADKPDSEPEVKN